MSAETFAIIAFARTILASPDDSSHEEVAAELGRALELTLRSESLAFEPLIRTELAELARRRGDGDERERELRAAQRLFAEIGASVHAAKLARELEPLRS